MAVEFVDLFSDSIEQAIQAQQVLFFSAGVSPRLSDTFIAQSRIWLESIRDMRQMQAARAVALLESKLAREGNRLVLASQIGDCHAGTTGLKVHTETSDYALKCGSSLPYRVFDLFLPELSQPSFGVHSLEDSDIGWFVRDWIEPDRQRGVPRDQAYCLGAMIAIAYCLNCADLHFENFLVTERGAAPIDLECMIYPFDSLLQAMQVEMIGAIGTIAGTEPLNGRTKFKYYSDPWLRRGKVALLKSEAVVQHTLFDASGTVQPLRNYDCYFREGFTFGYHAFLRHKERVVDLIKSGSLITRKLFRPTRFYRVLASELMLYHHCAPRLVHLRMKWAGTPPGNEDPGLYNYEIAELMRLNIPIYHADVESGRLLRGFKKTGSSLRISPLQLWEAKLALLSEDRMRSCADRLSRRLWQ